MKNLRMDFIFPKKVDKFLPRRFITRFQKAVFFFRKNLLFPRGVSFRPNKIGRPF